jgi:hypothetical protein
MNAPRGHMQYFIFYLFEYFHLRFLIRKYILINRYFPTNYVQTEEIATSLTKNTVLIFGHDLTDSMSWLPDNRYCLSHGRYFSIYDRAKSYCHTSYTIISYIRCFRLTEWDRCLVGPHLLRRPTATSSDMEGKG